MYRTRKIATKKGFTLVELSIALVIIGLLLGGVLVAQNLIRSATVKTMIQDIERIESSIHLFKSRYKCLPGDCATAFGGSAGNGNRSYTDQWDGNLRLWLHLQASGMINLGLSAPGFAQWNKPEKGVNIPDWKWLKKGHPQGVGFAGLYIRNGLGLCGDPGTNGCEGFQPAMALNVFSENTFVIGGYTCSGANCHGYAGSPFPSDLAMMYDGKVDDGQPRSGKVMGLLGANGYGTPTSWGDGNGTSCGDGTTSTTQGYRSGFGCMLFITPRIRID
jgi:prepilin-type N-terminal cleavage/methylation domain-containing protein